MKQILPYISIIFLFSCKLEVKNSNAIESFEEQLNEMEKQSEKIDRNLKHSDSLITEIQNLIEKNKFIPDVTIIDEKYSLNPFELQNPLLKNLFESQYSSVDTTLFNNRHVDNQIDTVFTFKYGSSFIEIYKNSSEEFIKNGFSNSDTLNLNRGLRYGMSKTDFLKLLSNIDSVSNLHNNFRIQNSEIVQNVDFKFVNDKLEYIHFEGYLD
ncbi:hypothetical protein [Aquimarina rubra]|uniref:Uncharacterized protein n=1 Tax=Aquimarina rubra TaxID=1920033 RepID=A0ABW5LBE8_9FLAO